METQIPLKKLWESASFGIRELPLVASELKSTLTGALGFEKDGFPHGVVALQGEMGAGKTTLVKAIVDAWGFDDEAVSPTFGLVQCYVQGANKIYHLDLYRLVDEEEAWDLGLTEYFDDVALNFVEWPEQAPGLLPEQTILLQIRVEGEQHDGKRKLILSIRDTEQSPV